MKVTQQKQSPQTILTIEQVHELAHQIHGDKVSLLLSDECIGNFRFKTSQEIIEEIEITYVKVQVTADGSFKFWPIQPMIQKVPCEKHTEYLEKFKKFALINQK